MNKHVILHNDVLVCGTIAGHMHICLRPPGHWGSHVVRDETGKPHLLQTGFCEISFPITEAVAQVATQDESWSWAE